MLSLNLICSYHGACIFLGTWRQFGPCFLCSQRGYNSPDLWYLKDLAVLLNLIHHFFLATGTKETAFMYAVTSAGVVHAVTKACSSGNLTDCTCDLSQQGQTSGEGWKWGGCSDNVDYGMWFAETFVDAPEKLRHTASKDIRSLMNLQNNAVGRQVSLNRDMHF